jgi:Mg2+/citrate symporter
MIKSKSTLTHILFYLTIALLMISIHQSVSYGFTRAYFLYMITFSVYLWYNYRRTVEKREKEADGTNQASAKPKPSEIFNTGKNKRAK